MKTRFVAYFSLTFFALSGCSKEAAPIENFGAVDLKHGIGAEPLSQLERVDERDLSLELTEYIEGGVPAYDRIWFGSDMDRAAQSLALLVRNDPNSLPRYESERSGRLFARIISDEVFDYYRSIDFPIQQRGADALLHFQACSNLLKLYLGPVTYPNRRHAYDIELVEIHGKMLRCATVLVLLTRETIPPSGWPSEASEDTFRRARNETSRGMALLTSTALDTLTQTQVYRTSALAKFVQHMKETFPWILSELSEANRLETIVRVRTLSKEPRLKQLRLELEQLVEIVEIYSDKG